MRNEENIGFIVRGKSLINSLSQAYQTSIVC